MKKKFTILIIAIAFLAVGWQLYAGFPPSPPGASLSSLLTALGITSTAEDMGTYTGDTLTDNTTQAALNQELEDAVELKAPIANAVHTGTFQVPSLRGTPLSAVPNPAVDGVEYWFLNSSDGGADDPSDITGTVPYKTIYDLGTTSYIALHDYDGNILVNKTQTRTSVSGPTASFAATCTGGCLYGGTYLALSDDGDLVFPAVAEGMNFEIITVGAIQVVADPNASDGTLVDGVANADGHALTNTSTTGDWARVRYMDATGWLVKTNGWTLE